MNSHPIYTVDFFIKKFEAIPEEKWVTGTRAKGEARCALGWCYKSHDEALESMEACFNCRNQEEISLNKLCQILDYSWAAGGINNGIYKEYQQPTPKQRILAALYDIKDIQEKQNSLKPIPEKIKTVYVTISETLKEPIPETQLN